MGTDTVILAKVLALVLLIGFSVSIGATFNDMTAPIARILGFGVSLCILAALEFASWE